MLETFQLNLTNNMLQNRQHGFSDLPRMLHLTSMALNCRWCKGAICTLFHNFFRKANLPQVLLAQRPQILYPRSVITLVLRIVIKWVTNIAEAIFANFWWKESDFLRKNVKCGCYWQGQFQRLKKIPFFYYYSVRSHVVFLFFLFPISVFFAF